MAEKINITVTPFTLFHSIGDDGRESAPSR
jgi:hypothetical protein